MILQTLCDSARCQRNLTGYEIFAAALRLMVKQDTVYCKHVVSFSIFLGDPEAVLLCNCIGAVRVEWCCLSLGNLFYLAVQLGSGSLINLGLFGQTENADCLQNPQHADRVHVAGILRYVKRNLYMGLCSQVVDFIRLYNADDTDQGRGIGKIPVM